MSDELVPGLSDSDFAQPRTVVHRSAQLTWDEYTLSNASLAVCGWGGIDPDDVLGRTEFLENHQFTERTKSVTCIACKAAMVERALASAKDWDLGS